MSLAQVKSQRILPVQPDWGWLRFHYEGEGVLAFDQKITSFSRRVKGKFVYLATPFLEHEVGQWQAAKCAAMWQSRLAERKILCHSPAVEAWRAETSRGAFGVMDGVLPDCRKMLAESKLVVVPPMKGWDQSEDVWAAVQAAILMGRPIHVLKAD